MIPNIKIYSLIAFYIFSIGASVYLTSEYKDGKYAKKEVEIRNNYTQELEKRQQEYNTKVEALNREALKQQAELANLNSELERKYGEAKKRVNKVTSKYNNLVANGWRLRDPNNESQPSSEMPRTTCGDNSTTTNSSNGSSNSGELSREATEFLLSFASDADKVVEQLKITQEYALRLRQACQQ